jgi:HEAT repeat protein
MRRAFILQEWHFQEQDEKILKINRAAQERLAERFEKHLHKLLADGDVLTRVAAVNMIAEVGTAFDPDPSRGAFARRLTADLLKQIEEKDPTVRAAAARAVGKIGAATDLVTPVLDKLLQNGALTDRQAAAEALQKLLQETIAQNRQAPNQNREARVQSIPDVASVLTKTAGRGLADADPEVRQKCHSVIERAAEALTGEIGDPPDLTPDLPEEVVKNALQDLQERWKRCLPLQRSLSAQVPALIKNAKDESLPATLSAYRALYAIGQSRAALRRWASLVRNKVQKAGPFEDLLIPELRRAVPELAAALSHKEVRVQLEAIYVLETLEPDAAPASEALTKALEDKEPFVRWGAARVLRGVAPLEPARAVPALAGRLDDQNGDVRHTALLALQRYGPASKAALNELAKAAGHKNPDTRALAVEALGAVGKEAQPAAAVLIKALSDSEARIREAAVLSLVRLGPLSREARAALRKAMSDPNEGVRQAAADALLGDK